MLIIATSLEDILMARDTTIALLRSLGFTINLIKSCLTPSQCCEFLGMVINSVSMTISLPEKKIEKLIVLCREMIEEKIVSLRKLAKIIGKLQATSPAIPEASVQLRDLQQNLIKDQRTPLNYESLTILSKGGIAELRWWIQNLRIVRGANIRTEPPQMEKSTDASMKAWGAHVKLFP